MKVVFSDEAKADLQASRRYIAQSNPERALTFVEELTAVAVSIGKTPLGFQPRDDLQPGLRQRISRPYLIFYTPRPDCVFIDRIVHGARDLPRLFRRKP